MFSLPLPPQPNRDTVGGGLPGLLRSFRLNVYGQGRTQRQAAPQAVAGRAGAAQSQAAIGGQHPPLRQGQAVAYVHPARLVRVYKMDSR